MHTRIRSIFVAAFFAGLLGASHAQNQQSSPPGGNEIRIGNTSPYTGPLAPVGVMGDTVAAYFEMVNSNGGINGRTVVFVSYDDSYSPPRTLELTRRLVEQDQVHLIARTVGTSTNVAIRDYLNQVGIPQLFIVTGAEQFDDPDSYPWTMRWNASLRAEGEIYGRYIAANYPDTRIGVLYQNDDVGDDYLAGLRDGLGDGWDIVLQPYGVAETTVDPQIDALRSAGVDVFVNFAVGRFATQALRRLGEVNWHPPQIQGNVSASVGGIIEPAGVENAIGNVSAVFGKDPGYPAWANDADVVAFLDFMAEYYPEGDPRGVFEAGAYAAAYALHQILIAAGDDLSPANIMLQAASIEDLAVPMLMPGIRINTGPDDFAPVEQFQMVRFDGVGFEPFGPLVGTADE